MHAQKSGKMNDMQTALKEEIKWCQSTKLSEENVLIFKACIRVLYDLAQLRWLIVEQGYGFALEKVSGPSTEEHIIKKRKLREELQPIVYEQMRRPSVSSFIFKMEKKDRPSRCGVQQLMADGNELAARLEPARQIDGEQRVAALADAIKPYLQEADGTIDHVTGLRLREIWRYFRYSWSIPQIPIPGRQLLYLVRDAAHSAHPVIGIAALNNCPLEMGENREKYIGWHYSVLAERFKIAAGKGKVELEKEVCWIEQQIKLSLGEIDWSNLVSEEEVETPDNKVIRRLEQDSQKFADLRKKLLKQIANSNLEEIGVNEWDDKEAPPVNDEVLKLESITSEDKRKYAARKQLVAKKRASGLSRLLNARIVIAQHRNQIIDPNLVLTTLRKNIVRSAINVILDALKGRRAGANMLEITTCGAIAPYSRILGGKLVALMMLSPRIAADYRRRYMKPSIISSQMKNYPVIRDNSLVYLGTTSLYVHGSSQYNRLSLPSGTIAPDQEIIRFHNIGQTAGFGTVQFSPDTSKAIDAYISHDDEFKEVNSIFGEGTSPKLRKLRMGLRKLGFEPEKIIQHKQHRLIYAIPLFPQARNWLLERTTELPSYVTNPKKCLQATERIVTHWRRRWLASRLRHEPTMSTLKSDCFQPLGMNSLR